MVGALGILMLLPEQVAPILSGCALARGTGLPAAFWFPAAVEARSGLWYTHSLRHFPLSEVAPTRARRREVDQLDADLFSFFRRVGPTVHLANASVSGELGWDYGSLTAPGFPRTKSAQRREERIRIYPLFPWFRVALGRGVHWLAPDTVGNSFPIRSLTLRLFPWLSVHRTRKGAFFRAQAISLRLTSWLATGSGSSIRRPWWALCAGPLFLGQWEGRRFYGGSLRLPGFQLTYAEAKDWLPFLLRTPLPRFRNVHLAAASWER